MKKQPLSDKSLPELVKAFCDAVRPPANPLDELFVPAKPRDEKSHHPFMPHAARGLDLLVEQRIREWFSKDNPPRNGQKPR